LKKADTRPLAGIIRDAGPADRLLGRTGDDVVAFPVLGQDYAGRCGKTPMVLPF
jgi:hypothetical protein